MRGVWDGGGARRGRGRGGSASPVDSPARRWAVLRAHGAGRGRVSWVAAAVGAETAMGAVKPCEWRESDPETGVRGRHVHCIRHGQTTMYLPIRQFICVTVSVQFNTNIRTPCAATLGHESKHCDSRHPRVNMRVNHTLRTRVDEQEQDCVSYPEHRRPTPGGPRGRHKRRDSRRGGHTHAGTQQGSFLLCTAFRAFPTACGCCALCLARVLVFFAFEQQLPRK